MPQHLVRGRSDASGLSMTAHNYRHGVATVLVKRSLANIEREAILLNHTPGTVRKNDSLIH